MPNGVLVVLGRKPRHIPQKGRPPRGAALRPEGGRAKGWQGIPPLLSVDAGRGKPVPIGAETAPTRFHGP
jgi:hypothetical protein